MRTRRGGAKRQRTKAPRPPTARAKAIRDLCAVAERPAWAADLIARGLTLDEARRAILRRLADESAPEIRSRPSADGPPTDPRLKPALAAYLRWRAAELLRVERAAGPAASAAARRRREEDIARRGYRRLVADHGLADVTAAWARLRFERVRARLALRAPAPADAPPVTAAAEEAARRESEAVVAALAVLPPPGATDPLAVADPGALDAAVAALVQAGTARDRDEAARIVAWRSATGRANHLAALLNADFRERTGLALDDAMVREAAGGFSPKRPRQGPPVRRGRPAAERLTRAVVALDARVRELANGPDYRAVAVALLYHGWERALGVDWQRTAAAAETALFAAAGPRQARAAAIVRAAIVQAMRRVKQALDRARRRARTIPARRRRTGR